MFAARNARGLVGRFAGDEDGTITVLMAVLFLGIIAATGIAIDLMRFETRRSDLQDAVDRGVLAAASLTQTSDVDAIVSDYMDTRSARDVAVTLTMDPENVIALNSRHIGATADYDVGTFFLRMIGSDTINVGAGAAAEERQLDVEISLALDISGSMAREQSNGTSLSRLQVLRTKAKGFVDTVLGNDTLDKTSVSLIPYAGQVALGQTMFDRFAYRTRHNYSRCIEFTDGDYASAALPGIDSRDHVPHFQWFRFEANYGHEADWGWCPTGDKTIVPLSNDLTLLKQRIDGFRGHDGTGTQNAMKWALGLLDPSSQSLVTALNTAGEVPSYFVGRPAAYGQAGALKIIVLMTDGNIRYQQRPRSHYYDSSSEISYWSSHYLSSSYSTLRYYGEQTADEALRVQQFLDLCQLAKQNGVIVFTIGFDVGAGAPVLAQLNQCASSPSHFFNVEGLQLGEAFAMIASTIQRLKLVE